MNKKLLNKIKYFKVKNRETLEIKVKGENFLREIKGKITDEKLKNVLNNTKSFNFIEIV